MKRLFTIILCALMLLGVSACGKPSDTPGLKKTPGLGDSYPDDGDYKRAAESATTPDFTTTTTPATTPKSQAAVELKDGESFYTGHLNCPQAKDFQISFALSADLGHIHDIKIVITDFKASVEKGNKTSSVKTTGLTEIFNDEYPISFKNNNNDISIGKSMIRTLVFTGNSAFIELDYVYFSSNTGSGMGAIEIPLDTISGELTTQTAPVSAGTADVQQRKQFEKLP